MKTYDIKEVAEATGTTPSVLRIWEQRYGWPRPKRQKNGYRQFTEHEIQEIRRVAAAVRSGTPIGSLVVDGEVVFPSTAPVTPAVRPVAIMRAVPAPATADGRASRARVEAAAEVGDTSAIYAEIVGATRLHPSDRPAAVYAPVIAYIAEAAARNVTVRGLPRLERALQDAVGPATVAEMNANVDQLLGSAAEARAAAP